MSSVTTTARIIHSTAHAGPALAALGRLAVAHRGERADRHHHGDDEEVLHEAEPAGVPEPPEREVAVEQRAPRLDHREAQDDEAPHGEEVRQART
jgi:hypothetical protein